MMPTSYSKIYQLGHRAVQNIFCEPILIEEKVDGSQFSFGVYGDKREIECRSKGSCQFDAHNHPNKMFIQAVETVKELAQAGLLQLGWTYRGEYLSKPKHNTLAYDRVPVKNIVIFDIDMGIECYLNREEKEAECERIGLECVPVIFEGKLDASQDMLALLERKSFLGGQNIEGMVFKQYNQLDPNGKTCMAKYVSEAFKEVHVKNWTLRNPNAKDILTVIGERFKTHARFEKARQHLRDAGRLKGEPSDIGALVKEVQKDITEEEIDAIKNFLLNWARPKLNKHFVRGLPEWYKRLLAEESFNNDTTAVSEDGDGVTEPDTKYTDG
jgi:hypothetical protein